MAQECLWVIEVKISVSRQMLPDQSCAHLPVHGRSHQDFTPLAHIFTAASGISCLFHVQPHGDWLALVAGSVCDW